MPKLYGSTWFLARPTWNFWKVYKEFRNIFEKLTFWTRFWTYSLIDEIGDPFGYFPSVSVSVFRRHGSQRRKTKNQRMVIMGTDRISLESCCIYMLYNLEAKWRLFAKAQRPLGLSSVCPHSQIPDIISLRRKIKKSLSQSQFLMFDSIFNFFHLHLLLF